MTACALGFVGSVVAFRHKVTSVAPGASWVKWRWYAALPPLQIAAIVASALLVRGLLVPETPPLLPDQLAEVAFFNAKSSLYCFLKNSFALFFCSSG